MKYFLVNLAIHVVILIVFITLMCIFAGRNRKRKTRHILAYFLPLAFALMAIFNLLFVTGPRLLDINSIISSSYYYDTGKVEKVSFLKNSFVVNGRTYYVNPLRCKASVGKVIRIGHTPYSLFAVEISKASAVSAEAHNAGNPQESSEESADE